MFVLFTVLIISITVMSGYASSSGAITGCVLTRSMTHKNAVCIAAVCTFAGGLSALALNARVAMTFFGIASLVDESPSALSSLCCALLTALLWSLFAHSLSLPTSESHALLSGLTGAALSQSHSFSDIMTDEWKSVFLGFALSTVPAFILGFIFTVCLSAFLRRFNRRRVSGYFRRSQKWSAAWHSCLCGVQNSQKFGGVYILGLSLYSSGADEYQRLPLSVLLICTLSITLGTLIGGSRIIKCVGGELCALDAHEYSSADLAASFTVTLCTMLGLPADLLQSRACSFFGAGLIRQKHSDIGIALRMLAAWLVTFPVCISLGFILSELSSQFFTP